MYVLLTLFAIFFHVSLPILGSTTKIRYQSCSMNEITCSDGSCVSFSSLCDGITDCPDGLDESACDNLASSTSDLLVGHTENNRNKRQAGCKKLEWQCRDGQCIQFYQKCDGYYDCKDHSDETHALCKDALCQPNWFRCTYGACIDGTAPCNGITECADNSDELLPRCRNGTDVFSREFKCQDGKSVPTWNLCDGNPDCADGSDETIRACAGNTCLSYLFQCAYGACVDQGADCNGKQDCADGSDESDELCNRILPSTTSPPTKPTDTGSCVLPPYPDQGTYVVKDVPSAVPGMTFLSLEMNVTCRQEYGIVGSSIVVCFDGKWLSPIPKCERFCKLNPHPSVHYHCLLTGEFKGQRRCSLYEPSGTIASAECNAPNYYSAYTLPTMRCSNGSWNDVATCIPECGKVTPEGEILVIGGRRAKNGELPWHAGIYRKTTTPYSQICGGSLVSTTVVISAAHCFWSDIDKKLPAKNYAVAVGKLYRPWNDKQDVDAQKSDVSEIHLPVRFHGGATNFQEDIAIVILASTIEYKTYVQPVCLNFEYNFERRQLVEGKMGKVAGWGLTAENGVASPVLKVTELPYVDIGRCFDSLPPGFKDYITSDKICAGYNNNGTPLCKGDGGGGLVFPKYDQGVERYYLRGIVSTAPNNENLCNANTLTTFTRVRMHEDFIKMYL